MENLKQEEYEYLKKYEDRLNSAISANYVRAIPSGVVHKMREIYSRLIGQTYSMNENCGACVLTLCRKLYKPYEEYKQSIEWNSNRQVSEEEQNTGIAVGGEIKAGNTDDN